MRGKRANAQKIAQQFRITPAGAGKTGGCSHNSRAHEDHPRRCGENFCNRAFWRAREGSPPQVRGKPLHKQLPRHAERITPAGAGKTACFLILSKFVKDHPRRCGENGICKSKTAPITGSPPQVRGKRVKETEKIW